MINNTGKNTTEINLHNMTLLLSYNTPVAWFDGSVNILWVTEKKWSKTTSKHINKFKEKFHAITSFQATQDDLDLLYKNILQGKSLTQLKTDLMEKSNRFDDLII